MDQYTYSFNQHWHQYTLWLTLMGIGILLILVMVAVVSAAVQRHEVARLESVLREPAVTAEQRRPG